jgi:hypothetical protein
MKLKRKLRMGVVGGGRGAFIGAVHRMAAAAAIADEVAGRPPRSDYDFPTIDDGVIGLAFIETAVKSSRQGARWVKFPKT